MFDTTYIYLHSVHTKEGGGGNTIYHVLEYVYILFKQTNFIYGHSQIFTKMLSKVFFVIKKTVYCRYWQNDRIQSVLIDQVSRCTPGSWRTADQEKDQVLPLSQVCTLHLVPCPVLSN